MKLTPAKKRALAWIKQREPIGQFDKTGPALSVVHKLEEAGLIERAGKEPGQFGFVTYRLTAAGSAALSPTGDT